MWPHHAGKQVLRPASAPDFRHLALAAGVAFRLALGLSLSALGTGLSAHVVACYTKHDAWVHGVNKNIGENHCIGKSTAPTTGTDGKLYHQQRFFGAKARGLSELDYPLRERR